MRKGVQGCLACDLSSGRAPLPGGLIFESGGWLVEHCIGPLGVGTLLLKPARHVERFADLAPEEAAAFGPLVHLVTRALRDMLSPDQTYVCQWAHAGWTPGHIHFVVQPSWDSYRERYERPGVPLGRHVRSQRPAGPRGFGGVLRPRAGGNRPAGVCVGRALIPASSQPAYPAHPGTHYDTHHRLCRTTARRYKMQRRRREI